MKHRIAPASTNDDSEALRRVFWNPTSGDAKFARWVEAEAVPPPCASDEHHRHRQPGRWVRAVMSARQQLTTVGEVVLVGLISGVAAVVAVVVAAAAALAVAVVLLGWWF